MKSASPDSRVQRFDGFERSQPAPGLASESALDRILETIARSANYMPAAARAKLAELWDPDTALAFGFLLAVWIGVQFTPAGWLVDAALAAYGLYEAGKDFLGLAAAVVQASEAKTETELDAAARAFAAAMTDAVIDAFTAIVGAVAFARLRRLLRAVRSRLLPRRFGGAANRRLTLVDRIVGAGGAVTAERAAIELGKKKKDWQRSVNWSLGIVGAAILVGGVGAVALTGGKHGPR